ncbi:MAG: AAA family ATPase, partial [Terriglobales bacterium]
RRSAETAAAPVVGVLGAKGGCGATTVCVNLSIALAQAGHKTTIIDANLQHPDVAQLIGKEPLHSMMELLVRAADLDKPLYHACCTDVVEGMPNLHLLSPALNGEAAVQTNLSNLASCLSAMRSYSDFWVLDLPRHVDKHLVTLTDMCDRIVLVFEATVSGVATSQRWLSVFKELGYPDERIVSLVNRAGSKFKAVEKQLPLCFGDRPLHTLPNASEAMWNASTRAVPICAAEPKHQYTAAMSRLAQQLSQSILKGESIG